MYISNNGMAGRVLRPQPTNMYVDARHQSCKSDLGVLGALDVSTCGIQSTAVNKGRDGQARTGSAGQVVDQIRERAMLSGAV